jgi:hypothetical protein
VAVNLQSDSKSQEFMETLALIPLRWQNNTKKRPNSGFTAFFFLHEVRFIEKKERLHLEKCSGAGKLVALDLLFY